MTFASSSLIHPTAVTPTAAEKTCHQKKRLDDTEPEYTEKNDNTQQEESDDDRPFDPYEPFDVDDEDVWEARRGEKERKGERAQLHSSQVTVIHAVSIAKPSGELEQKME